MVDTAQDECFTCASSPYGTVEPGSRRKNTRAALSVRKAPDLRTLAAVGCSSLVPELAWYPQHDPPLSLREANDLTQYHARGLVSQCFHRLLVEEHRLLFPVQEVRGGTPKTPARAATWPTVGSGIRLLLIPSTSSSVRSPALIRATSALV